MKCKNCGFDTGDFPFCPQCGSSIQKEDEQLTIENKTDADSNETVIVTCPSCGTTLKQGDRFCGTCGTPIGGADKENHSPDSTSKEPLSDKAEKQSESAIKKVLANKKLLIAAAAIVLIVIIILCVSGKGRSSLSSEAKDALDTIDQSFEIAYNEDGFSYRGYEIDDDIIIFNIVVDGGASLFSNYSSYQLSEVEGLLDDLCMMCYEKMKGYGYHVAVQLLSDQNEHNVLYSAFDGYKVYSAAD